MIKFIEIYETSDKNTHRVQTIRQKECLGYIKYNPRWKVYTFRPDDGTEFSWDCMADISAYAHELDNQRNGTQK